MDENKGFFTSPASTKYHGCYEGGLAKHSWDVYIRLVQVNEDFKLECPGDSMILAALLHDICKVGAYQVSQGGKQSYSWNRAQPKGHAMLSLIRIAPYITLTDLEEKMIKYHMGVYGLTEFDEKKGEYHLRGGGLANAWFHYPIVKMMYFCDEFASAAERAEEGIKS